MLTFPNVSQHRLYPFKLADPSKPGHRKVLALFLVNPNFRIVSTAKVPPQRKDWWSDKLCEMGVFNRLSREVYDMIIDRVDDFPIGIEQAKELRLEHMEETKYFFMQQTELRED